MKWTSNLSLLRGALLGILLCPMAFPGHVQADMVNVNFYSDADKEWHVLDANGKLISDAQGAASMPQAVCLNDTSPPNCPPGAVKYGHVSPGDWPTSLKPVPGAKWIWAPNVTGQTSPAAKAEFTFTRDFYLCSPRADGTIHVAVDDTAEVSVNGIPVLTTTSNQLTKKTFPRKSLNGVLTSGFPIKKNTITIKARNSYLDWCDPAKTKGAVDNYQCNPAGLVVGASFPDDAPSCTGSKGEVIPSGQTERNCPSGQIGSTGICVCGSLLPMNDCVTPPQTCADYAYSGWSACGADYKQTRTVMGRIPAGCIGEPVAQPVLTRSCSDDPPKCDSFTYSAWGQCQQNGKQTRSVLASSPTGCTGGTPVTSQSCPYTPPLVGKGDRCGSLQEGLVASCPAGTSCGGRKKCTEDCPWWDWSGLFCSQTCLVSTDWYCDP
ncbi:hypothetical protein [Aquabacterium sp.]|uniref:hypothetical protein n=1 Tax=Aquabacterium sp. TaxID=1872578 RepID=UPI0024892C29|nr:hypothetical protein [Aquabacterium sp.]MDI1259518.1 hypothetical protein [Aquabacterium sp.]